MAIKNTFPTVFRRFRNVASSMVIRYSNVSLQWHILQVLISITRDKNVCRYRSSSPHLKRHQWLSVSLEQVSPFNHSEEQHQQQHQLQIIAYSNRSLFSLFARIKAENERDSARQIEWQVPSSARPRGRERLVSQMNGEARANNRRRSGSKNRITFFPIRFFSVESEKRPKSFGFFFFSSRSTMDAKDTHNLTLDFDRLSDCRKSQTSLLSNNGEETTPFSFSEVSRQATIRIKKRLSPLDEDNTIDLITILERA